MANNYERKGMNKIAPLLTGLDELILINLFDKHQFFSFTEVAGFKTVEINSAC